MALSVIVALGVNELCDVSPWLARRLVRIAAHVRYADGEMRVVRAEEWAALIDHRPGKLMKLATALGLMVDSYLRRALRAASRTVEDIAVAVRCGAFNLGHRSEGGKQTAVEMAVHGCLVGPERFMPLPIVLGYTATDPFRVSIDFNARRGGAEWQISRELLGTGLRRAAGDGDFQVWGGEKCGRWLWFALSSPDGNALFRLRRTPISRFIRDTYTVVAPGTETNHIELDSVVSRLLNAD